MYQRRVFCLSILIGLTVNAQTINLGGIVSNKASQPIANAIVTLVRQGMKDTTGTDGKYSLTRTVAVKLPAIVPKTEDISMNNGVLQFTLSNSSPVKVELFDAKGILLKKEALLNAAAGVYRFNIAKNCQATNLIIIKAAIGKREVSVPYMPLNGGKYALNPSGASPSSIGGGLAKMAAVLDTLKVTANGFQTKTVTITSYDNQQQNISLDSSTSNGKNSPGPSAGCGKDLSSIKSGTYTITSASRSRKYIIEIPANYDKNNPYRLIFGMHCMGSSAQGTVSNNYYGMKTLAANDKIPCIFVAPQGESNGTWRTGSNDNSDHVFLDDMLKLFKENLCVDTTRIFSIGFSYGAMITYSFSLNHQKQLRAVACFAPANYNIYLPTNTHEPIAYYQTTGKSDGTCPWDNGGRGGKYCLQGHIQDNGCTLPSTIPLATGNTHVSTEFQGCKPGYPVKFGSFNGGHADNNTDAGSSGNWIYKEAWEFFMRF